MAENIENKIRAQVNQSAREEVSRKIIQNWDLLEAAVPGLSDNPPSEKELMGDPTAAIGSPAYNGIAAELIKNREASVTRSDGVKATINLEAIDKKLTEFKARGAASNEDSFTKLMGGMDSINALVPTTEGLEEVTQATKRGIDSQSGFGNTVTTFISAALTWATAAIGSFLGKGQMISFSQAMAQTAAPNVGDAVRGELQALANDPSKASSAMLNAKDSQGRSVLDAIANQAEAATYTEMGAAPPAELTQSAPALAETKPNAKDTKAINTAIKKEISGSVLAAEGAPAMDLKETILAELSQGKAAYLESLGSYDPRRLAVPTDAQLETTATTMADTISSSVADTLSDPEYKTKDGKSLKQLSDSEMKDHITEKVGEALLAKEAQGIEKLKDPDASPEAKQAELIYLGATESLSSEYKDGQTYLDVVKSEVREQLDGRTDELRPIANIVGQGDSFVNIDPALIARERQVAKDSGIKGDGAEIKIGDTVAASSAGAKPAQPEGHSHG